jgi:hypothetical protein
MSVIFNANSQDLEGCKPAPLSLSLSLSLCCLISERLSVSRSLILFVATSAIEIFGMGMVGSCP